VSRLWRTNGAAVLRQTQKFKWKNGEGRRFYGCSRFPACRGIHGAHPDGRPLGIPGNAETKLARIAAHAEFNALYIERCWNRRMAYSWLGQQLGLQKQEIGQKCHIAMFDIATCAKVVEICKRERGNASSAG
jgi:hypothetical protein